MSVASAIVIILTLIAFQQTQADATATPITEVPIKPTDTPTVTPSNTPSLTPSSTLTFSPSLSPTNTPTPTYTPTPISGVVIPEILNVRQGPSVNYRFVTSLVKGDGVTILQRTPESNWLKIETPNKREGWVATRYIKISGDIGVIDVALNSEPPTPPSINRLPTFVLGGNSIAGRIAPHQEQWYTFFAKDPETVIVFMFIPNINFSGEFPAYNVLFFLYDGNQIPIWPPSNSDALANFGAGSLPSVDRDGNLDTGELIWAGPLPRNIRFYMRIVNRSDKEIQYCLAPSDVYYWSCP